MGKSSLQLLCSGSSSTIQTASDCSWHRDPNFQVATSLQKCHTFIPNFRAIQQKSTHHSIHQNSNHRSMKCWWDMSVHVPKFPSLSPISSFQDVRDQFSMFCPCASLWRLGSHLWFFLCSFRCPHSWTMICSVCPCQTIACLCSCVHCSLVDNVLHRT